MDLEKKRREVIKYLRDYNLNSADYRSRVVLAAPAHNEPNKIRVYMNGGNVGKIALNTRVHTTGIKSEDYTHVYDGEIPKIAYVLDKKSNSCELDRLDALIDPEYLEYVQKATSANSRKDANDDDKERMIETIIMDRKNQHLGNAAIDMEMQYSVRDHFGWTKDRSKYDHPKTMTYLKREWYNESSVPDFSGTKSPRVDLMVLNDDGIGFVELKVDNENCNNLSSHISHMEYILSHQDVFIKDIDRRLSVLKEYDLLEPEMRANIDKWESNHQIWCGILFVGDVDKLSGAKQLIENALNDGQDIKCCFIDKSVVKKERLDLRSEIFVNKEVFLSSSYVGERKGSN